MQIHYAIVFSGDMQRSIAFYRDVVGLPLKFETPGWTEFATEGSTLALHKSDPDDDAERPGTCRTGFEVPDLDAFHRRMMEHGITCRQEPTLLFGARLAQYVDPDGMVFSVGEARGAGG